MWLKKGQERATVYPCKLDIQGCWSRHRCRRRACETNSKAEPQYRRLFWPCAVWWGISESFCGLTPAKFTLLEICTRAFANVEPLHGHAWNLAFSVLQIKRLKNLKKIYFLVLNPAALSAVSQCILFWIDIWIKRIHSYSLLLTLVKPSFSLEAKGQRTLKLMATP